jgi:3'(2'), 5'-bisphosphate nucleotidase
MDNFMDMSGNRLAEILDLTRAIGWGTADILTTAQQSSFAVEKAGESPVTSADLAANRYILDNLQAALGTTEFAYLSEETFQTQPLEARLDRPWVWIIDPLDGTKDFINRTGNYASHIALAYQGRPVLAVVVCPEAAKLYYAINGEGAFVEQRDADGNLQSQGVRVSTTDQAEELILVSSANHRDDRLNQLLQQMPFRQQIQVGSVGVKIAAIVEQRADVYLALSGKSAPKDWDFAAPELILTEAGGQFTHFDGTPLLYNQVDVNQWGGILVSNGHCHADLCAQATTILAAIDRA